MRRSLIAGLVLAAVATVSVQAAETKPEDLLKARQGLFQSLKQQFGPIVAVSKGEAPLSPDTALRAANIVALAKILPTAFGPGTDALPHSNTKAEAFTKPEFLQGFTHLGEQATKLEAAIAANDADGIKAAVAATGKTCKACHDDYKAD